MIGNSHQVSNFSRLFLKLNRFICNQPPVLPEPCITLFRFINNMLCGLNLIMRYYSTIPSYFCFFEISLNPTIIKYKELTRDLSDAG